MSTPAARFAVAVALVGAALLGTVPAHADEVVGGDQLSSRGVVVDPSAPKLPTLSASSFVVADLDTGAVLAAKDPHGKYLPASTLKALTALTLIPKLDVHQSVEPTFQDANEQGTRVGIVQHVSYPIGQLFTAMLVVSGNDAADTLATANGGLPQTVVEMNAEAQRLQAFDTHAGTVNGLDAPGQRSSAYDLALIARAGMQLPDFRAYVATKHSQIRGKAGKTIAISSHDKLLYNYPGAIGIKNGFTVAARATFIGAAARDGHTLVVTFMHTVPRYWPEAAALLDWGFAAEKLGVAPVGQLVDPVGGPVPTAAPTPASLSGPAPTRMALKAASSRDLPLSFGAGVLLAVAVVILYRRRAAT